MKVCVDLEKCIHAGECYYNHPELFKMKDDGQPTVLVADLGTDADLLQHAEEAAEVCPAAAISVVE